MVTEKTREETLAEAERLAEIAVGLQKEIEELTKRINIAFPPKTWGMTPKKAETERSLFMAIGRLQAAVRRPFELKHTFEWQDRSKKEEADRLAKQQKAQDEEKRKQEYLAETIVFLVSRGKVLGTDFYAENAIHFANDLVFSEKVRETISSIKGFIDFNGQNCDGPCEGWDGESHRCQCGNRRVSWEGDGDWKQMFVHGEAY